MSLRFRIARVASQIANMNVACKFRLLDLPNELIALIIEQLDCRKALWRLARTCRRIQHLAEPVLYRSILIRASGHANELLNALRSRPERCAGIHFLELPCDPQYRQDFRAIAQILNRSRNLKELSYESPQCNNGNFEDETTWETMTDLFFAPFVAAVAPLPEARLSSRPMQRLKKCKSNALFTLNMFNSDTNR